MRDKKGQVLIEIALILPLLLLLVFGIVDYARAMYMKNSLTNAARSGARVASVTSPLSEELAAPVSSTTSKTGSAVKDSIFNGIPVDQVSYEVTITDNSGTRYTSATSGGGERIVTVTVTYGSFSMITPFDNILAIITKSTPSSSKTLSLTGQASMRYE